MTSSVVDWEQAPKHFPKPNLHQKTVRVTVRWFVAHRSHYSFLNPGETIISEKYTQQINEMHQKLQCPQPSLINRKGPILLHDNAQPYVTQPIAQKSNELGYKALHRPPYSPDLSQTNYHFFKYLHNFLQGKCFHNQQETEKAFQGFIVSRGMDFYATRINNFIFIGKNVLIVMVPILINKDVSEPSY